MNFCPAWIKNVFTAVAFIDSFNRIESSIALAVHAFKISQETSDEGKHDNVLYIDLFKHKDVLLVINVVLSKL